MSSRRLERLSEALKQEVSKIILYKLKNIKISFITVTKAEISPDLKKAKVYISVLGDDATQKKTLLSLEHAKVFIQSEVGAQLQTRYTPTLTFCLDESLKKSMHISKLIDEAVSSDNLTNKDEKQRNE